MKTSFWFVFILITAFGLFFIVGRALNTNEIVECNTWKKSAEVYPAFYLTEAEAEQCDRHGIVVNANVVE